MRAWKALTGLVAALAATAALVFVPAALADPGTKVTFCHRTGSESNPYVVITTDLSAWLEAHNPTDGHHPDLGIDPRSDFEVPDGTKKEDCDPKGGGGKG